MKRITILLTAIAVTLFFASTAVANSVGCGHGSTCLPGQGGQGGTPAGSVQASGVTGVQASGNGTLPFTGLNLAMVAGVAILLLVGGVLLHRTTRREQ